MKRPLRRYSGNDKHFGPFTLSKHTSESWKPLGAYINSGAREDSGGWAYAAIQGLGYTLMCEIPNVIPDFVIQHETWNEIHPRQYGAYVSDHTLFVQYGPQTHDSDTTKSNCFWLPWSNWRFIRQSWYGLNGEHLRTVYNRKGYEGYEEDRQFESTMPKLMFEVRDYDGARVFAKTHIEEREWRLGLGLFKWVSWFTKPKIVRSLAIEFSNEIGKDKGSWKGGLVGTSIEMLPGELHEGAFRRFCEQKQTSKNGSFFLQFLRRV
jgi:hypothetical protein